MRAASYCDVTLIYYSDTVSMDAFIITMALSARAIQHGAHRHDRRGIYRCVLLRFRGRIEIDHSYGLRCRGLCCHSRHSTRGPAGAAARRPAHSCCARSGSTNHSSADRIVVNSHYQGNLLRPWPQKLTVLVGQCWHLDPPFTCADKDLCR